MSDLRPQAGDNPWWATWDTYEAVSRNTDGTIKPSGISGYPSDATKFLNGNGGWTAPAGGSGTDLGWFNVQDYGAVGDGTTDDSAAIQSAINAAVNARFSGLGGTVFFPSDKYYVATGLTCVLSGTAFVGQGQPGVSSDLSTGCTQIIVGNSQWGLTLGDVTGEYRGYQLENLQFYEKNAGLAFGGVRINRTSYGTFYNCGFGKFSNSVSTTYAGTNGVALSTLSTLTLASTTGWPSAGSGFLQCVPGVSGQIYHSFWYTGVSGSTLTGVTYNAPTTDTVASGAAVTAAVGVGFLNNGGAGTAGESSNNRHLLCNFGTATFGYLQLGISLGWFSECMFDGHHNIVAGITPAGTGLMIVSGSIQTSNCQAQGYDVGVHICKGNQNSTVDFRYEGFGSASIILEADGGTSSTTVTGPAGNSQISGHGPAVWIKSGVNNAIIDCIPNATIPVLDQGTGTRYPRMSGYAQGGPSLLGSVIGRQAVYDPVTGSLIGYTAIYDAISGIALVRKLDGATNNASGVTTVTRTLTAPAAAGDWVIIGGGYGGGSTRTVTVTDTQSNTYTTDRHDDMVTSNTPHSFIASAKLATALSIGDIITVTFSATVNFPIFYAYEYSGILAAAYTDQAVGATGTGTAISSGAATTGADYELLFSACYFQLATFTAGSGWTEKDQNVATAKQLDVQVQLAGAAGSYTSTATLGSSQDWACSMVTYKKA